MSWEKQDVITSGRFILVSKFDSIFVFVPGSATEQDVLERVVSRAIGWTPTHVLWDRGILGIGSTLRIYGRASVSIPSAVVESQTAAALNSFWGMTDVTLQVFSSNTLQAPAPAGSEWGSTIQLVAVAVIALAIVYGIKQIREITQ